MCLGIPGQIVAIVDAQRQLATVDVGGVRFDMKVDARGVHVAIGDRAGVRYGLRTDDGFSLVVGLATAGEGGKPRDIRIAGGAPGMASRASRAAAIRSAPSSTLPATPSAAAASTA